MKNQYFPPRTLPKPPATFPELSGSARELPGAAEMLSGRLSSAPAPARAESGRPQNWSPAISGSPNPLKINEKSIFSDQNPSKTSCNLPRAPWKRHRASCSSPAPARAESGRPQNWSPAISGSPNKLKIHKKSIFSAQNPSKTYCNLPRAPWKRQTASWSRPKLSEGPSGAQAPARAESGRPQNWSPAFFVCIIL